MEIWIVLLSAAALVMVSASVMTLLRWLWPDGGLKRLSQATRSALAQPATAPWVTRLERLPPRLRRLLVHLSRWSLPTAETGGAAAGTGTAAPAATPQETAVLPLQFERAGWRSPHALWLFGASKTLLTALGFTLGILLSWVQGLTGSTASWWGLCLGLAAAGYLLPDAWLRSRVSRRRQALFRAFPDALDMLRICVQAGLGLDAAIERVGREMALGHPALAQEWRLTGLELRAGASRRLALQNLARRVGLREVDAMVTMLIQADRFGTRMSDALQVHAQVLRTERKQQAETAAAQLPVKLLIPLIFCIFPALLTVMLGPVALSLYAHFSVQT